MRLYKSSSTVLMSWNVNGLRALLKLESFSALQLAQSENFDVLCLQETKIQEKDEEAIKKSLIDGYDNSFWTCSVTKLGYSGTAIISRFLSHPAIADLISEEDQKVLKYMVSLDVEDFKEDKPGYSITFNFSTNPYFEDAKLTKTLLFSDEGSVDITGTKIKWKEGKDITKGVALTKGVAQEKKGKKRPLPAER